MNNSHDRVLKDAADLHRFLQPIERMCAVRQTDHPYYRDASYEFFSYIHELIQNTFTYLENLPKRQSKFPEIQQSVRQKLRVIRNSWGSLHQYIKPALDADALHLPYSLLNALNGELKQVHKCQELDFAVFHLKDVNYVMLPNGQVNSIANRIARIVKAKDFPPHLTLVGFPSSQSSGLFLNCLIPHEMAHFVYQEVMID